jgi:hypothetical protein
MSFQNTIRSLDKFNKKISRNDFINTDLNTGANDFSEQCRQLEGILNDIKNTETEVVEDDIATLMDIVVSPRKSFDLNLIKTKKLELEEKIKEYKRPEKPGKPKKIIRAKIANNK